MADVEITLKLKDELTNKIAKVAELFDSLKDNVDLSRIESEITKVEGKLDSLAAKVKEAPGEFDGLKNVDLSSVVEKIGSVSSALGEVGTQASSVQKAVAALKREIASMKDKTITITTIRHTIYKSSGKASGGSSGASEGSNPFSEGAGGRAMSSAEGKNFTERTTLPALKILAREGKVEKVVL